MIANLHIADKKTVRQRWAMASGNQGADDCGPGQGRFPWSRTGCFQRSKFDMKASEFAGITWRGPDITDEEILAELPVGLFELLRELNGFVLHGGALHVRGACLKPEWHSLRVAWRGEMAFHHLYDVVQQADVPFAQDSFGDQFIWRDEAVWRLFAETGEVEEVAAGLNEFWESVNRDIEGYLNVSKGELQPGQLSLAYPPFCVEESEQNVASSKVPALEAIAFHANLAQQLRDVPEGAKVKFNIEGR